MTIEKAKQVINDLILSQNNGNEVVIADKFQVSVACTVLSEHFSDVEIKVMFEQQSVKLQ